MTGGWKPFNEEDFEPLYKPRPLELSDAQRKVDGLLALLRDGARFRRRAIRALLEVPLTFAEWRVLRATSMASTELEEAVSQQLVARRAAMDVGSAQKAMRRLERRGLVNIGFDQWGWAQRILVSEKGDEVLGRADELVAQVAG